MASEYTTRTDAPAPPPPDPGDVPALPAPFIPVRLVGQGGFGQVWEAIDDKHRRRVAVKVAHRPTPVEAEGSYLREARTLAQLDHPNVVPVYDSGLTGDRRGFLVSKFVSGGSLDKRLAGGPLPPEPAAHLVAALADGLQHAHERGVVHRDVKPANVLLDGAGRPLLIDFGLALWSGEQDHSYCGTPAYMSPEQARGAGPLTGQSDVFSLGVVLYELLAGRRPFEGATLDDLREHIVGRPPAPVREHNPRVPGALAAVCAGALAKPLAARYPSAAALADDLRRFLAGPWDEATEMRGGDGAAPPADLPAWRLRVVAGPDEGAVFPLRAARVTLGRHRGLAVALTDKCVSRVPRELVWDGARRAFVVTDEGPYFVCVNGRLLRGAAGLRPGDTLRVGRTDLRLEEGTA
jgi:serine/threonine protein kinase